MTADLTLWLTDVERWQFMYRGTLGTGIEALNRRLNRTPDAVADLAGAQPDWADASHVRLLVPAERVLATSVALPARTRRQLQRALPFAVEEKLAIDLDRVHIASSTLRPNEVSRVRVIDPEYLDAVLTRLRALGLQIESVYSDADCLPLPSQLTLLVDGDRALLRDHTGRALACARSALALVVRIACNTLRADDNDAVAATVYVQAEAPLTDFEQAALLAALSTMAAPGRLNLRPVLDAMSLLSGHTDANAQAQAEHPPFDVVPIDLQRIDLPAIDLLQGRFARPRAMNAEWKLWKPVAIAALVLIAAQPLLEAGRAWRFDKEADRLEGETAALYTSLFPGEAVPVDIRRAFEKRLGGDQVAGVGFRVLLAAVAEVTSDTPGFELQSISYQRERDELALGVLAGNLRDLERFKSGFATRRMIAEVSSAEQEQGQERVRARLRVHSATRTAP